jgi:dihydrofolate reductase
MGKLIYGINLTLDGCCDHTKGAADEATFDYWIQLLRAVDFLVYGRKTYELMVPYWPDVAKNPDESKRDREFAEVFVSKRKYVFSRTLESGDDKSAKFVRTDLRDEILKLKNDHAGDLLAGGVDIPSQLIELGLVDEHRFVIQPIIVGEGRRLMEGVGLPQKLQLKLAEAKTFKSGSIALRYLKQ